MMTITPSKLRENLFKLLDEALEKGETIEVKRKGQVLKIVPPEKQSKLERLQPHDDVVNGDAEELINIDWGHKW